MTVQSPCESVITDVKTCVSVILRYWYNKEGETLAVYQSVKTVMTVQSPCESVITDVKTCVSVILR